MGRTTKGSKTKVKVFTVSSTVDLKIESHSYAVSICNKHYKDR